MCDKLFANDFTDTSFKYKSSTENQTKLPDRSPSPPINLSTRSWLSTSSPNDSLNQSMASSSWAYSRGSPTMPSYQPHLDFGRQSDSIIEEQSLQEYLRQVKIFY